jgi:hypothetical protein
MSAHNHTATPSSAETSASLVKIVITSLGFQMVARAEKARRMARALFQAHIPASDAARMTSAHCTQLQTGLSRAGVLGRYSNSPSAATIERTIGELQTLEAWSAVLTVRAAVMPMATNKCNRCGGANGTQKGYELFAANVCSICWHELNSLALKAADRAARVDVGKLNAAFEARCEANKPASNMAPPKTMIAERWNGGEWEQKRLVWDGAQYVPEAV